MKIFYNIKILSACYVMVIFFYGQLICLQDGAIRLLVCRYDLAEQKVRDIVARECLLTFGQALKYFDAIYKKDTVLRVKKNKSSEEFYLGKYIFSSLLDIISLHPEIIYVSCDKPIPFAYKPFELSEFKKFQPHQGLFAQTFVTIIPKGKVASEHGFIMHEDKVIQECLTQGCLVSVHVSFFKNISLQNLKHISGRVAVLTRINTECYAHWMCDILPRLSFLQKAGIAYDYLYVPIDKKYMKETLALLNVDASKILTPAEYPYIQADELIFPSLTARRKPVEGSVFPESVPLCEFMPDWTIHFLRESFLPHIEHMNKKFAKKIFISRQDASIRKIINEDEVFAEFEKKGFVRYHLSKLSFLEQVYLFSHADIVVGAHGAGLMNIVFCKSKTKVIEIFQARSTCTFCYLSQSLGLDYVPVKTTRFELHGFKNTKVSLDTLRDALAEL